MITVDGHHWQDERIRLPPLPFRTPHPKPRRNRALVTDIARHASLTPSATTNQPTRAKGAQLRAKACNDVACATERQPTPVTSTHHFAFRCQPRSQAGHQVPYSAQQCKVQEKVPPAMQSCGQVHYVSRSLPQRERIHQQFCRHATQALICASQRCCVTCRAMLTIQPPVDTIPPPFTEPHQLTTGTQARCSYLRRHAARKSLGS